MDSNVCIWKKWTRSADFSWVRLHPHWRNYPCSINHSNPLVSRQNLSALSVVKALKQLRSEVCAFKERGPPLRKRTLRGTSWTPETPVPTSTTSWHYQSVERKPGSEQPTTLSDKKRQRKLKRKTEGKSTWRTFHWKFIKSTYPNLFHFYPIFRFAGLYDYKWYRISLNLLTEDILQWMWVWIDMKWCPFSSHGDAIAPTTVLFMLNHYLKECLASYLQNESIWYSIRQQFSTTGNNLMLTRWTDQGPNIAFTKSIIINWIFGNRLYIG